MYVPNLTTILRQKNITHTLLKENQSAIFSKLLTEQYNRLKPDFDERQAKLPPHRPIYPSYKTEAYRRRHVIENSRAFMKEYREVCC